MESASNRASWRRIFIDQALAVGEQITLDQATSQRVRRVLRAARGDQLCLFNGDGADYIGEVVSLADQVVLQLVSRWVGAQESPLSIVLVQSLMRANRLELVLQKTVELGVSQIDLIESAHSGWQSGRDLARLLQRWRAIIIGACEQSGRSRIPTLNPPLPLEAWLSQAHTHTCVAFEPEAKSTLSDLPNSQQWALILGPEAGFSAMELAKFDAAGIVRCRMGPRILRAESASLVAVSMVQMRFGDLDRLPTGS